MATAAIGTFWVILELASFRLIYQPLPLLTHIHTNTQFNVDQYCFGPHKERNGGRERGYNFCVSLCSVNSKRQLKPISTERGAAICFGPLLKPSRDKIHLTAAHNLILPPCQRAKSNFLQNPQEKKKPNEKKQSIF